MKAHVSFPGKHTTEILEILALPEHHEWNLRKMLDVRGFSSHDETTNGRFRVAFLNRPGFRHSTGSSGRACVVIHEGICGRNGV